MAAAVDTDVFIGVDGGGTKTAISVVSSSGRVLASVTVGSTNPNSVGDDEATRTLHKGIMEALDELKLSAASIRAVVLSISGCNSAADGLRMNGWMSSLLPGAYSTLVGAAVSSPPGDNPAAPLVNSYNDSIAALVSGTNGRMEGIVVIAGTGMICKGFAPAPAPSTTADPAAAPAAAQHIGEWTAGGNGALIDGGSGYSIGIDVLRAAFSADDGKGPTTPLLAATLQFLGKQRAEQLVDWLYSDPSWSRASSLAPLAFKYAESHVADYPGADGKVVGQVVPADPVALTIVQNAADYLVNSVRAVANKLNFTTSKEPVTVVCAGGVLHNPLLLSMVTKGVHAFMPEAKLVHPQLTPSEGAALLALSQWKEQQQKQKQ